MRPYLAFLTVVPLLAGCSDDSTTTPGEPRTIRFPGDAATLQEAIDAARSGDTVEVAAGTHAITAPLVVNNPGIRLVGAASPLRGAPAAALDLQLAAETQDGITVETTDVTIENLELRGAFRNGVVFVQRGGVLRGCRIEGGLSYSVWCPNNLSDPLIEGNLLLQPGVFGVSCVNFATPTVLRNTIIEAGDCGIYSANASPDCERNIIWGAHNFGVACFATPQPSLVCNDVFASVNADWYGCAQGASDISMDPLFCGDGSYRLQPDSPCAAANSECGAMGALDELCPGL